MRKTIKLLAVFILILQFTIYSDWGVNAKGKTLMSSTSTNYVLASNDDFIGKVDGEFRYIGNDEYVEIPHKIKGVDVTSYEKMFSDSNGAETSNVKGVKSTNKNVTNMSYMFYNSQAEKLDLSSFDTSKVTDMLGMFSGSYATDVDLSSFNTSSVEKMGRMFEGSHATGLNLSSFDTSKVTDMGYMFTNSRATELDVSKFDTGNVTDMSNMFYKSHVTVLDMSSFDTGNVTDMSLMFYKSQATELDVSKFDTGSVTDMGSMFEGSQVVALDLRSFDTSKVTDMSHMFRDSKVTELDMSSFDTSKVTDMSHMFRDSKVTELDMSSFDTGNVTDMSHMFRDSKVTELDMSSFDTSNVTNMVGMFQGSQATRGIARTQGDADKFNNSPNKPSELTFVSYVLAKDDDFDGDANGEFRYIGNDEYVKIPHKIKGVDVTSYEKMFSDSNGAETSNVKGVKSTNKNVTNMSYMFQGSKAKSIDLSSLDTSGVKDMLGMFSGSEAFDLDLSLFNTSNVEDMSYMFIGSHAKELDLSTFDTSSVKDMLGMFSSSQAIDLDLSSFNTSNVTDMSYMFQDSEAKSIDLSSFNTSNVTNMSEMFSYIKVTSLNLDSFDTSNVTDMSYMFQGSKAKSIDLSSLDTSNVKFMRNMFEGSLAIKLDLSTFDTSNVTDMSHMFANNEAYKLDLSSFNTSNVENMSYMFNGSHAIKLDLGSFDTGNVTDMGKMFFESHATKGYAKNQTDADRFNSSSNKPEALNFVVKGISVINFEMDGNDNYEKVHDTKVEVEVLGDDLASLQYQWTDSKEFSTSSGTWLDFNNNDTLSIGDVTGDYYLHIKSTGDLGITTEVTSKVFKLDNDAPKLNLFASTEDATNQNVIITATATDDHSDITQIRMVDDDWKNTGETTFSVSENGTYTFEAKDKLGNTITETIEITNIDKTAPSAPSISGPYGWQSTNQTITITHGTDKGGSGVDRTEYKTGLDGKWLTYDKPFTIVQEGQTTIYARTIDKVGNKSNKTEATVKIDRTTPILTLRGDNPLSIFHGDKFTEPGYKIADNFDENVIVNVDGEVDTNTVGTYEIIYKATDHAENTATVTRTVNVVAPDVVELELGQSPVHVYAGTPVELPETKTTIQLPNDLPEGTMLHVESVNNITATGLVQAGEIYNFVFTYPEGHEDYTGEFILSMGVDKHVETAAIYHYNEQNNEWEHIGGDVKDGQITAVVNHFSTYGVFSQVEEVDKKDSPLPKTATNTYNWLMIGGLFIILAIIILVINRKRQKVK